MIEAAEQGTITWDYDALGRLTEETFSDPDFADLLFTHDLAGHRKRQQRDTDGDGLFEATDETTDYVYDANDRLLEERVDLNGDGDFIDAGEKVTIYGYGPNDSGTQQTSKQVYEASVLKSLTTNSYDYQGRLNSVTVHTYDTAGHVTRRETTTYVYDATGIRVSSRQETDADGDGSGTATITTTTYLSDPQNHTGYAQTLEEVTKDGNGVETKRIVYTIGHDQISQTVYEGTDPPVTHTLHADGHGSTRVLTDAVAAILQHYAYDAHGNVLGFDPATALTSYLYSGEHFDARIGQQYLRARWYDATTGRFNRLDPFFGNLNDPQSLHKYLYVHGDPVNGVDPSGMFLSSVNVSMVIQAGLATVNVLSGTANVYHGWQRTVDGLTLLKRTPPDLIGSAINFALATFHYGLAIWDFSSALSGLKKPPAGSAGGLVAASVGRVSGRSIITILAENPALGRYILEHLAPAVAGSMGHFIGIATPRPQSLDAFTFASSANDPRDQPGTASGGTNLPAVKGKWLEGGVAGYVPPQVANQLRGRSFDNWRHFREEFWRAVAKVPHLRDQFNAGNGKLMEGGTAPKAPPDLQWKSRDQYILHHIEDLQYGGSLYDLDNLLILAPKTHNGIHNVPFGTP